MEREAMVVTKSAAPDTLPDSVSVLFVTFHVLVETHKMLVGYQPQSLHQLR
jgi:hypothetical protein